MADVLTHVLVGYVLGTVLSVRYAWLRPAHVTLVMIGALSPDFVKIYLLFPDGLVAALVGAPFSWDPVHTLGGNLLVLLLGTLCVSPGERRRAFSLLAAGALTHHVLDVSLLTVTGHAYAVFWPLTAVQPPSGGLYLSSDAWPALVAGALAAATWVLRYRWLEGRDSRGQ
ncbi:metal-dependent hydrolase [Saliphagus infecundisoli]|uniref:Metal-dependent hydrolase n=1 Tax=Saliphagus infecundisoli TaxID=1849069 RepID=A0ABD5QJC9_9EURY|nr:metal-dependent hydrolase [Saliphagus infecundisoli]